MKKKIIFIILLYMLLPTLIKAASVSVSLNCPSVASANSEISCKVNVTSDVSVNGISGNYSLSGLSYVNFAPQNGFTTYSASSSGFAVGNTSGKSGTFTVGIITLKANNAGSITINNLDISDTSYNSYNGGSKTASIRLASTNNDLGSLSLSNGTLSPSFSASTTSYTATIDSGNVTINATKGDNYQTISGTGIKNLNYGNNKFNIVVTSESGSSKTYTINITRPDNRSKNNNLKSLSVDKGSISFNKNTTSYKIDVDSNITSVKVNASTEDSTASFVNGFGPRTVNLNYGSNSILIKVKAQNQSEKTYTITVNRKDDRSTNNYLKTLSLTEGKIVFNKDTLEYNISVDYDITKIDVNALVEDTKAKVVVNNKELVVGDNVITIDVTSENGSVRTYKINVKRLSEAEKMSDNNNISKLEIFGQNIKFSNKEKEYKIKISKEETELMFNIELEDEKASYVLNNNKNLKDGSIVKLIVISQSGIESEYKFIISKEKDNSLLWYILIGTSSLIIGFVLGFITSNIINKKAKVENTISKKIPKEEVVEQIPVINNQETIIESIPISNIFEQTTNFNNEQSINNSKEE